MFVGWAFREGRLINCILHNRTSIYFDFPFTRYPEFFSFLKPLNSKFKPSIVQIGKELGANPRVDAIGDCRGLPSKWIGKSEMTAGTRVLEFKLRKLTFKLFKACIIWLVANRTLLKQNLISLCMSRTSC